MKRSVKKIAWLDRFYKKYCCGPKNHPSSWKNEKKFNSKTTRRRLKGMVDEAESEDRE